MKNSLKNKEVKDDVMKFLRDKIYDGADISSVRTKYIKNIPEEDSATFIAPLIIKEILDEKHLSTPNGENEGEHHRKSSGALNHQLILNDLRSMLEKLMTTKEGALEAMGLIRLAAFHKMFIQGMEETLAQIIEDEESDEYVRVEAAVAYSDIKEQSRLNNVDKSKFCFDKKREKKFITLISGDKSFERLNNEEPLQAVQRYGVVLRNKIEFEFSAEAND